MLTERDDRIFYAKGKLLLKVLITVIGFIRMLIKAWRANDYDVIFVQREAFIAKSTFFERIFARSSAKLVYDFDDAIWIIDVSEANKKLAWLKDEGKPCKIMAMSDVVIAGNAYLANYALNYKTEVEVIPTVVDTDYYIPKKRSKNKEVITIGWTGSMTTNQHFKIAEPWLIEVKQKYGTGVRIIAITEGDVIMPNLDFELIHWNKLKEIERLQTIDIGIMPLPDYEWTKGKCGFKGIQYMGLGIPTLLSPVGVNVEIVKDGENGYLPETSEEWVSRISELVESASLREKIGLAGRKVVEERYSVDAVKEKFISTLY